MGATAPSATSPCYGHCKAPAGMGLLADREASGLCRYVQNCLGPVPVLVDGVGLGWADIRAPSYDFPPVLSTLPKSNSLQTLDLLQSPPIHHQLIALPWLSQTIISSSHQASLGFQAFHFSLIDPLSLSEGSVRPNPAVPVNPRLSMVTGFSSD